MTAKEIADLFEQLELHLIASLKRNLMRHKRQEQDEGGIDGVPEHWEMWQSAKLRDIRRFRRENQQILGQYRPVIEAETEAMLREQYAEGNAKSFFHSSDARLDSLIREMQNNEVRVERAALRYMNDVYRKTVLRTATAMNAGGMTLQQAADEATKDFLAQGINCVQYANGRRVNIASYAEMALRACSTRAMLMGEARQRERLGLDTVLVSQYGACSDTCLPWQGKVYIDDVFQDYRGPGGGSFGISRNGRQYMLLSIAIQGGLFHPNCRHTVSTWIEGVSTMPKQIPPAQIEKVNKLERQQRKLELEVRKTKREAAGLTDTEAQKAANAKVREKQAKLREFIRKHDDVLRRDYWRERDTGVPKDFWAAEAKTSTIYSDVLDEYIRNATPGIGSITYDDGYSLSKHVNEVTTAKWLQETFGGDIKLLNESSVPDEKKADYLWKNRLWDLKNTSTSKAADSALRSGLKQIIDNPGGIILDYGTNNIILDEVLRVVESRMKRGKYKIVDIMIVSDGKAIKIMRYKK